MNKSDLNEQTTPEPLLNQGRQEKAKEYTRLRRFLTGADLLLGISLLSVILLSGLGVKLKEWLSLPAVPAAFIYLIFLTVAYEILSAPLDYYRGLVLPRRYGLSKRDFAGWLQDGVKARALGLIFSAGITATVYWLMTLFPAIWWLLGWGLIVLLSILLTSLAPVILLPLFVSMKPLADIELKSRLEELAGRAQTKVRGIYVAGLSQRGNMANAALMGLGNTRRIALSDTLLKQYSPAEVEVIAAHELGHNRNNDTFRLLLVQSMVWLVGFYIIDLGLEAVVSISGFDGITDMVALPLLVFMFAGYNIITSPLLNTFRRQIEIEADDFTLRLTNNTKAFISAMTKLTDQNLIEAQPNRWVELLGYDHPSYQRRVAHAHHYSASSEGE